MVKDVSQKEEKDHNWNSCFSLRINYRSGLFSHFSVFRLAARGLQTEFAAPSSSEFVIALSRPSELR